MIKNFIGKQFTKFQTIDSTNSFIKRNIKTLSNGYLAFSMNQTNGYGSRGRKWTNFKNKSLAVSVLFKQVSRQFLNLSTKLACVCALNALHKLDIETAQIKWFNDLIISNKKVAGVLGESQICGASTHCILGLGINLLQQPADFKNSGLPYAGSVLSQTRKFILPEEFLKEYVANLNKFWLELENNFSQTNQTIQKIYLKNCATVGCKLKIINNSKKNCFLATAEKILSNGNLLVKTDNNALIELVPAQFSVSHIVK